MTYEIVTTDIGVSACVKVSKGHYRKTTIIKVLYELTGRFYIFISEDTDNYIISITCKKNDKENHQYLLDACGDLGNDLIDQELRQIVIEETGEIRNEIMKKAFSEAAKGLESTLPSSDLPKPNHSYVDDKKNILALKG